MEYMHNKDNIVYSVDGTCYSNETTSLDDIIFGIFYASVLLFICVICFIGNGLIIHAVLYYPRLRTVHNWFVLSLAVSDLLQGVTIPFYSMGHTSSIVILEGLSNWKMCQFMVVMITAPQTISAYNIVGVTLVRFMAIVRPLHYKTILEKNKVVVGLSAVGIWLVGYLISALLYVKPTQPENFCGICRTELIYDVWQVIVFMLLNILIPVLVMGVMYVIGIKIIADKKKSVQSSIRRKGVQRETRMARVVSALLGFYTLSWTPFIAYEMFIMLCAAADSSCNDFRYIRATSRLFYFSNCAVNVFIYAGRANEFRFALERDAHTVRKCLGMRQPRVSNNSLTQSTMSLNRRRVRKKRFSSGVSDSSEPNSRRRNQRPSVKSATAHDIVHLSVSDLNDMIENPPDFTSHASNRKPSAHPSSAIVNSNDDIPPNKIQRGGSLSSNNPASMPLNVYRNKIETVSSTFDSTSPNRVVNAEDEVTHM